MSPRKSIGRDCSCHGCNRRGCGNGRKLDRLPVEFPCHKILVCNTILSRNRAVRIVSTVPIAIGATRSLDQPHTDTKQRTCTLYRCIAYPEKSGRRKGCELSTSSQVLYYGEPCLLWSTDPSKSPVFIDISASRCLFLNTSPHLFPTYTEPQEHGKYEYARINPGVESHRKNGKRTCGCSVVTRDEAVRRYRPFYGTSRVNNL